MPHCSAAGDSLISKGNCFARQISYGFGAVDGRQLKDPLAGRLEHFRRRFSGFGEPVPAYLAALRCDEQLIVGPIEWVELQSRR